MPKNKGKVSRSDPHQLFYCSFLSFFFFPLNSHFHACDRCPAPTIVAQVLPQVTKGVSLTVL